MRRRILRMNICGADLEVKGSKKITGGHAQHLLSSVRASASSQQTANDREAFDNDSGYE